jgi:opacity protein-like surface antigen
MSKWEDIVKDKLEGYESPLPEDDLAEFRARRKGAAPAAKRYAPRRGWVLAGTAAVAAAGLAALLLPPRPTVPENAVQIVHNQPVAEVIVPDAADVSEPEPAPLLTPPVQPGTQISTWSAPVARQETETETPEPARVEPAQDEVIEPAEETMETSEEAKPAPSEPRWTDAPFVPQAPPARKVHLNVAPVAGAVAGGGLLAAVLTPWARGGRQDPSKNASVTDDLLFNNTGTAINGYVNYGGAANSASGDPYSMASGQPGSDKQDALHQETATNEPLDVLSGDYTHYRPLKTGLSARIPLTEKLSLTTGLTYSLYSSKFTYSLSGEKAQQAHYLGVPVRLDWTLASNRWLDVYLGGGIAGDLCVGSTLGGNTFAKDGPAFSVLGAGGLQWNMTKRLGLYVEPELSWTAPSDKHVLKTYRQEHPLVFTVATGLRFNLGKQ